MCGRAADLDPRAGHAEFRPSPACAASAPGPCALRAYRHTAIHRGPRQGRSRLPQAGSPAASHPWCVGFRSSRAVNPRGAIRPAVIARAGWNSAPPPVHHRAGRCHGGGTFRSICGRAASVGRSIHRPTGPVASSFATAGPPSPQRRASPDASARQLIARRPAVGDRRSGRSNAVRSNASPRASNASSSAASNQT